MLSLEKRETRELRSDVVVAQRRVSPTVLTYHEVWPEANAYLYSVTCQQLEEHLRLIREIQGSAGTGIPVPQVSFDDGHISNHRHALPLLEKHSVPAVFFITAGFISAREGFLSWAELKEIASLGHEVQSHGWSHAHLTQCSDSELENELARSKRTLEDRLGNAVEAVSFPGGRWNKWVLEACARAGYKRVYTSKPWEHGRQGGLELHGRVMVRRTLKTQQLTELLRGKRSAIRRLRMQAALGETAKLVLGDQGYLLLWRMLARKPEAQHGQAAPASRTKL